MLAFLMAFAGCAVLQNFMIQKNFPIFLADSIRLYISYLVVHISMTITRARFYDDSVF